MKWAIESIMNRASLRDGRCSFDSRRDLEYHCLLKSNVGLILRNSVTHGVTKTEVAFHDFPLTYI